MPPVDFYILHTQFLQAKEHLAIQLADKAWHQGYLVHIHTDSITSAQRLDVTLWTFKDESFLPHDIYHLINNSKAPIQIGYTSQISEGMNVLINLTEMVPPNFEQFERIADIVDDTHRGREAGRTRYRFYRDRNYVLRVHDINR